MNATMEQVRLDVSQTEGLAAWSDEELLLEYRSAGNRRAFEELVGRYEQELFGYLRHYLGNAEMADDVFQQTFFQVHLKCDKFEQGRGFRPWLYTIATNQAIDAQRRNRRHKMVSLDHRFGSDSEDDGGRLGQWVAGALPDPGDQAETNETRESVRRVIDSLSDVTKQALTLVYFQGMKHREVAEALSIPVGTVKSRIHAALTRLEAILTPSQS